MDSSASSCCDSSSRLAATTKDSEASLVDLVVVGSGPHALALVTRLLDDNPDTSNNFWIGLGSKPTGHRETFEQLNAGPGERYLLLKKSQMYKA